MAPGSPAPRGGVGGAAAGTQGWEGAPGPAEWGYLHCSLQWAGALRQDGAQPESHMGSWPCNRRACTFLRHADEGTAGRRPADVETGAPAHPELYQYAFHRRSLRRWRRGSVTPLAAGPHGAAPGAPPRTWKNSPGRSRTRGRGAGTLAVAIDELVPAPVLSAAPLALLLLPRREPSPRQKVMSAMVLRVRGAPGEADRLSRGNAPGARERSDALVVFGISGDLAFKQIIPALQALVRSGAGLPRGGGGPGPRRARPSRRVLGEPGGDFRASWTRIRSPGWFCCRQRGGAAHDQQLPSVRSPAETLHGARKPLFYLAIPPSNLELTVVEASRAGDRPCRGGEALRARPALGAGADSLSCAGSSPKRPPPPPTTTWARSRCRTCSTSASPTPSPGAVPRRPRHPGQQRGKSPAPVSALRRRRAGPLLRGDGARGRGPDHFLQIVALLAMDPPTAHVAEAVRDEKVRLSRAVRPLSAGAVVRGQYQGYQEEPGLAGGLVCGKTYRRACAWRSRRGAGRACLTPSGKGRAPSRRPWPRCGSPSAGHPTTSSGRVPGTGTTSVSRDPARGDPGPGCGSSASGRASGSPVELDAFTSPEERLPPTERLLGDACGGGCDAVRQGGDGAEVQWRIEDPVLGDSRPSGRTSLAPGGWSRRSACSRGTERWHDPQPGAPREPKPFPATPAPGAVHGFGSRGAPGWGSCHRSAPVSRRSASTGPQEPGSYGRRGVTSPSTGSTIRHCASTPSSLANSIASPSAESPRRRS